MILHYLFQFRQPNQIQVSLRIAGDKPGLVKMENLYLKKGFHVKLFGIDVFLLISPPVLTPCRMLPYYRGFYRIVITPAISFNQP